MGVRGCNNSIWWNYSKDMIEFCFMLFVVWVWGWEWVFLGVGIFMLIIDILDKGIWKYIGVGVGKLMIWWF